MSSRPAKAKGQSHDMVERQHQVDYLRRVVEWFETHLASSADRGWHAPRWLGLTGISTPGFNLQFTPLSPVCNSAELQSSEIGSKQHATKSKCETEV
jgi:hypothetical protein